MSYGKLAGRTKERRNEILDVRARTKKERGGERDFGAKKSRIMVAAEKGSLSLSIICHRVPLNVTSHWKK